MYIQTYFELSPRLITYPVSSFTDKKYSNYRLLSFMHSEKHDC